MTTNLSTVTREDDLNRRRAICSSEPTGKVLIKITTHNHDLGLRFVPTTHMRAAQIEVAPTLRNLAQGTLLFPYRKGVDDSGMLCVENASYVRLDKLVEQLLAQGYEYTDGHCKDSRNGLVCVLQFERNGTATPMPEAVNMALFSEVFNGVYAYANPKNNPTLPTCDTINCRMSSEAGDINDARTLVTEGNLYKLIG